MTIQVGTLHDDVLLEIFDFYRQSSWDPYNPERVWNNKNGWFKLAHVCHKWRSVVLASPCRLKLRLYFAHDTSTRAAALQSLSHLPIIVDYLDVTWTADTLRCLISALSYPDRVCRIAIRGSHEYEHTATISNALDLSFPALESLELYTIGNFGPAILLASHFMTSIQSLRHLQLDDPSILSCSLSSGLLSVTTSLVDLTLNLVTISSAKDGASIFTHLQRLSHLRNLQVSTPGDFHVGHATPPVTTLLAELTYIRLSAGCSEIEWFVAGLLTPSLRNLYISINNTSDILLPNVFKFIRDAGIVFFAARLAILHWTLQTSLFARPLSIDDLPSKLVTIETESLGRPHTASSPMLATVEDIFLSLPGFIDFNMPVFFNLAPLGKFFEDLRNVRVLRLHHGLEREVTDMLQYTMDPPAQGIDPDRARLFSKLTYTRQSTLDIFPSLEEIVVYPRMANMSIGEKEHASVLDSFGPFSTARHQVGRPVKVFWDLDGKVPRYFMTDSGN